MQVKADDGSLDGKSVTFKLTSFSRFLLGFGSGDNSPHYVAYFRTPAKPNQWYILDDSTVKNINEFETSEESDIDKVIKQKGTWFTYDQNFPNP